MPCAVIQTLVICSQKNKPLFSELFAFNTFFQAEFIFFDDFDSALEKFTQLKPVLLIVECLTADAEEIKKIRKLTQTIPVLAVSAHTDEAAAVAAFQSGAITFIRLPCGAKEFHYRLLSILKNHYPQPVNDPHATIDIGNIKIYAQSNRVLLNNEIVHLTASEYNLLLLLAQNVNQIVSTEEMYDHLWTTGELRHTSRSLQMHLSKLRRKLALSQNTRVRLVTIHGKGYCLKADDYAL